MNKLFCCCSAVVTTLNVVYADQLTLHVRVKDPVERPVSNATVVVRALNKVGLNAGAYENDYSKFVANTDTNGVAKVVFNTPGNHIVAWVDADDCYPDVFHRVTYKAKPRMLYWADFEEREKELSVVLYRKKQPIPLYSYWIGYYDLKSPKGDGRYGFDLQKCDWVAPFGKGSVADFYFERNSGKDEWSLAFDSQCGLYKEPNEGTKYAPSTYAAKTNAVFLSRWLLDGQTYDGIKKVLGANEHFVIRSRVVCDEDGRIVQANYSKIDGEFFIGRFVQFRKSVFNPNVNDANLEADGERNLAKGRFRVR